MKRSYVNRFRIFHKITTSLGFFLLIAVIGLGCAGIAAGLGVYKSIVDTAPDISGINVTPTSYATFVYDDEGNQTAKLVASNSNRIPVTLDMIPIDLQHAFVAIEDSRFYDHKGIDVQGIIRAGFLGLQKGSFSQGASTITQQLIKNSVFTNFTEETFTDSVRRKIQEQYLAVELEEKMSKDDILVNYLNIINMGHNTLGVQAASLRYFGKSVSELTLSEDAVLAGITQNPSAFDPIVYPENNRGRRQTVLDYMLEQDFISQEEYDKAMADDPYKRIKEYDLTTDDDEVNSYFVDALTDQLLKDLQEDAGYTQAQAEILLYSGGLNIYSTQNSGIQAIADEEANSEANYPNGTRWYLTYQLSVQNADGEVSNYSTEMMETWRKQNGRGYNMLFADETAANEEINAYKEAVVGEGDKVIGEKSNLAPQPQISMTIEDQRTGSVVAIVGGRGPKLASRTLNRATGTLRQPGSTFKVVSAYAPALDAGGLTLATTYEDEPYQYEDGTPVRNWYGENYRGNTTLRVGIQNSMNIIAVKTLTEITPRLGYQYLLDFGFTTLVENETINGLVYSDIQQTLALGGLTRGVKNIELNGAYAAIANGGEYLEPKMYTKVTDHDGNVILDAQEARTTRQVLRPQTAWLLTSAMKDVVTKGTGTRCAISETPVAGKTGTTSDENDVWFAGYSNYYTATTWAGYDENTDLVGTESKIAQTLWHNVMERVHTDLAYSDFDKPTGIIQSSVCSLSGLMPVPGLCDGTTVSEFFDQETYPKKACDQSYHIAQQAAATVEAAQAQLDEANANLQTAAEILQQATVALQTAQASGDIAAIEQATAIYDTANTNYAAGAAQQQMAQEQYDAAVAQQAAAMQDLDGDGKPDGIIPNPVADVVNTAVDAVQGIVDAATGQ